MTVFVETLRRRADIQIRAGHPMDQSLYISAANRIEELEAALTDIRDARPVKLADGLVSSPQELVVQMQQRADRALVQSGPEK